MPKNLAFEKNNQKLPKDSNLLQFLLTIRYSSKIVENFFGLLYRKSFYRQCVFVNQFEENFFQNFGDVYFGKYFVAYNTTEAPLFPTFWLRGKDF